MSWVGVGGYMCARKAPLDVFCTLSLSLSLSSPFPPTLSFSIQVHRKPHRHANRARSTQCLLTDLIPLPHAIILLKEPLVMRHAVLAVDEAIATHASAIAMKQRTHAGRARGVTTLCSGLGDSGQGGGSEELTNPAIAGVCCGFVVGRRLVSVAL